ncbi:MAG: hypothetical protein HQM14_07265 [SAR324 cluster bacterium]|nr:hypothetical protein [SAR324 cluster bacterium]
MKKIIGVILLFIPMLTGCLSATVEKGLQRAQQTGTPLFISQIALQHNQFMPVRIFWSNTSTKTIEHLLFSISFFNEEGQTIFHKQLEDHTGPYLPIKSAENPINRSWWFGDWYQEAMKCLLIDKIEIYFEDGSHETVEVKKQLNQMIADDVVTDCRK